MAGAIREALKERRQEDYERVLGKLSISFSLLHSVVESFAWATWGLHIEFAKLLTKDMQFKHLVGKLSASMNQLELEDEEEAREISRLLKASEKLAEKRNDLLHALWVIEEGKPVLFIKRKEMEAKGEAPTVEEIERLCTDINETAFGLADLYNPLRTPITLAQMEKYGRKGKPAPEAKAKPAPAKDK